MDEGVPIEVGKNYWSRDNCIVSIIDSDFSFRKPFTGLLWTKDEPVRLHYYPDGGRRRKEYRNEYGNDHEDLVELVQVLEPVHLTSEMKSTVNVQTEPRK